MGEAAGAPWLLRGLQRSLERSEFVDEALTKIFPRCDNFQW
jgi:hypothetical protein